LPVETAADGSSPDVLRLLKVSPDGTSTWYPVTTASQCFGPVIEAHEPIPDGQGNILLTWDYFGNGSFCGETGTQVVHMSPSGQILGQSQLAPLQRLRSYFSDNDGDALLGQTHLFVTDGRTAAVGLNLTTSSIDLNWQPPGGPCTTFPCPAISLAGVATGDQLLVNQTGNTDGSSTLFALTPGSGSCPHVCETASSVPNATLSGFDFSGTVFSPTFETFFFTDDFFCMCIIPPSASGGAETIGGAVSAPDANTTPAPDLLPPGPEQAMDGKRESSVKITISPAQSIRDGDTASFSVSVTGTDPNDPPTYQWSFSAPKSAGNKPNVDFTNPTGANTNTDGHWFAYPNEECPSAPSASTYEIKVSVIIPNSKPKTKKSKLIINLPEPGGVTSNLLLSGGPEISFDSTRMLYFISGSGTLARNAPPVTIKVAPSSQFYNKLLQHENVHVQQYLTGMLSDLYTVPGLMAVLSPLTDSTYDGLLSKVAAAFTGYIKSQNVLLQQRHDAGEIEAYNLSDIFSPRYFYQRCGVTHFPLP